MVARTNHRTQPRAGRQRVGASSVRPSARETHVVAERRSSAYAGRQVGGAQRPSPPGRLCRVCGRRREAGALAPVSGLTDSHQL